MLGGARTREEDAWGDADPGGADAGGGCRGPGAERLTRASSPPVAPSAGVAIDGRGKRGALWVVVFQILLFFC